ncbi:MAG: hypothetical protein ABFR97_05515 [Thermodesulfobacteriota bacterium]
MYFWHVDKLVEDFRNDAVSEKEKFKYMLLSGIILTFITDPILWIGTKYSLLDTVNLFGMLVIVIAGTYFCYTSNRDSDNKDFVTRFMCIGIPVGIRIFAVIIPISIALGIVEGMNGVGIEYNAADEEIYSTTLSQVICSALFGIIYYLHLGNTLKSIASGSNKPLQGTSEQRS